MSLLDIRIIPQHVHKANGIVEYLLRPKLLAVVLAKALLSRASGKLQFSRESEQAPEIREFAPIHYSEKRYFPISEYDRNVFAFPVQPVANGRNSDMQSQSERNGEQAQAGSSGVVQPQAGRSRHVPARPRNMRVVQARRQNRRVVHSRARTRRFVHARARKRRVVHARARSRRVMQARVRSRDVVQPYAADIILYLLRFRNQQITRAREHAQAGGGCWAPVVAEREVVPPRSNFLLAILRSTRAEAIKIRNKSMGTDVSSSSSDESRTVIDRRVRVSSLMSIRAQLLAVQHARLHGEADASSSSNCGYQAGSGTEDIPEESIFFLFSVLRQKYGNMGGRGRRFSLVVSLVDECLELYMELYPEIFQFFVDCLINYNLIPHCHSPWPRLRSLRESERRMLWEQLQGPTRPVPTGPILVSIPLSSIVLASGSIPRDTDPLATSQGTTSADAAKDSDSSEDLPSVSPPSSSEENSKSNSDGSSTIVSSASNSPIHMATSTKRTDESPDGQRTAEDDASLESTVSVGTISGLAEESRTTQSSEVPDQVAQPVLAEVIEIISPTGLSVHHSDPVSPRPTVTKSVRFADSTKTEQHSDDNNSTGAKPNKIIKVYPKDALPSTSSSEEDATVTGSVKRRLHRPREQQVKKHKDYGIGTEFGTHVATLSFEQEQGPISLMGETTQQDLEGQSVQYSDAKGAQSAMEEFFGFAKVAQNLEAIYSSSITTISPLRSREVLVMDNEDTPPPSSSSCEEDAPPPSSSSCEEYVPPRSSSSSEEDVPLPKDALLSSSSSSEEDASLSSSSSSEEDAPLPKDPPLPSSSSSEEDVPLPKDDPQLSSSSNQEDVPLPKDDPFSSSSSSEKDAPLLNSSSSEEDVSLPKDAPLLSASSSEEDASPPSSSSSEEDAPLPGSSYNEEDAPFPSTSSSKEDAPIPSSLPSGEYDPLPSYSSSEEGVPHLSTSSGEEGAPLLSTSSSEEGAPLPKYVRLPSYSSSEESAPFPSYSPCEEDAPLLNSSFSEEDFSLPSSSSTGEYAPLPSYSSSEKDDPLPSYSSSEKDDPLPSYSSNEDAPLLSSSSSKEDFSLPSSASNAEDAPLPRIVPFPNSSIERDVTATGSIKRLLHRSIEQQTKKHREEEHRMTNIPFETQVDISESSQWQVTLERDIPPTHGSSEEEMETTGMSSRWLTLHGNESNVVSVDSLFGTDEHVVEPPKEPGQVSSEEVIPVLPGLPDVETRKSETVQCSSQGAPPSQHGSGTDESS